MNTNLHEKRAILTHRIVWSILLALSIVFSVVFGVMLAKKDYSSSGRVAIVGIGISFIIFLFALIFFINSLFINYKCYIINGHEVVVYAGFFFNYIKIDNEKFDEYNALISFIPIFLSCDLDGHLIESNVSTYMRIATKLDGKLLKNNCVINTENFNQNILQK